MRLFIRAFWGEYSKEDRILRRKKRVDGNVKHLLGLPNRTEFVTYVWGSDNYEMLKEAGVTNLKLVKKEPFQWDLVKYQYRHKLEAMRIAHEEDSATELVQLDWDCFLTKPLPTDFWERFMQKETFQANLYQYKRKKCVWRTVDQRKVPNGGFTYSRDKTIPSQLIKVWEEPWCTDKKTVEPTMARWIDYRHDGWIGIDKYRLLYEPEQCSLKRNSVYNNNDSCFLHWAGMGKIR